LAQETFVCRKETFVCRKETFVCRKETFVWRKETLIGGWKINFGARKDWKRALQM
jgi:hypothetical protein